MEYKELAVWQKSRELVNMFYLVTKDFPDSERYGLAAQIRRSAVSIAANIAEGCGRRTSKETIHFLFIARGSIYELETHMYLALDQNLIDNDQFDEMAGLLNRCRQLLSGFIRYFKKLK